MPLDLCHPTAPHEKLRLPEWYVSSLMMDRALDAICRRVKKFDRKHDVPYLAGYSLDGKTIYIDRHPRPNSLGKPNATLPPRLRFSTSSFQLPSPREPTVPYARSDRFDGCAGCNVCLNWLDY